MKKLLIIPLFLLVLSGCTTKQTAENNNDPLGLFANKEEKIISQEEDTFSKKLECGKLSENIEKKINNNKTLNVVILVKIFYSPQYNSCLYAYVIEDDTAIPECKLEGQMAHNDTFIIKDYSTSETILYQTKGCDDFWGSDFDKKIQDLEN